jgi:SAM-dependent methyltransferase
MERMDYFIDLYGSLPRAGPGDNASTRRALAAMQHLPPAPRILDIGCGPGMQTVELLRQTGGTVVALDLLPKMIARVRQAAQSAGVINRLETLQIDMHQMEFAPNSFDAVWSEGAIYFLGFRNGLAKVKPFVKPGGYVAVSEAVWLQPDPPLEAIAFWQEYSEIDNIDRKLAVISELGYENVDHFILPPASWTELYYEPLAERAAEYADKWRGIPQAEDVLAEARHEVAVFGQCSHYFSYAFFVMRRPTAA